MRRTRRLRHDLAMRWDALFADLEAQAAALAQAERAAEVQDRVRAELAGLRLVDRSRAALGCALGIRLAGGGAVTGRLARVGPDWLLVEPETGGEAVVPIAAVVSVRGLPRYAAVPGTTGVVESRLGLRYALRGIARDRSPVRLLLRDGSAADGTIDRVGADFVDVAAHPAAEPRRRTDVRGVVLIPFAGLAAVCRLV
jgi:hypothetical protein